jgi:orotate phosphoribosyltransferase
LLVRNLIHTHGLSKSPEPYTLASGKLSSDYIDVRHALDSGVHLLTAGRAMADLAADNGMVFDAVGGPASGADPLATAISIVTSKKWFSVRSARKDRGHSRWIEGTRIKDGHTKVLLIDDVVSTGGSLLEAYGRVSDEGGVVVGVIPLVDRGGGAAERFAELGVSYLSLLTHSDLELEPL